MNAVERIHAAQLRAADLLITKALHRCNAPVPSLDAELAAFCELSMVLAKDPQRVVRRFLEIVTTLCNAGTACLSLLRPSNESGQTAFRWEAVNGVWSQYEGTERPRSFSLCGLCLEEATTILVSHPAAVFECYQDLQPEVAEVLVLPLYDTARQPLGVVWVAHHDVSRFSAGDARMVERLVIQLSLALKLLQADREHGRALAWSESQRLDLQTGNRELAAERSRREAAEISESGVRKMLTFKNAAMLEVDHRAKNTLQLVANLLALQARRTGSDAVRAELQEGYRRLHILARLHEQLYLNGGGAQDVSMAPLLSAVGEALQQSYAETSAHVTLKVAADQVTLAQEQAIPMALLVNELITNAYKHAFPPGLHGEITVTLTCVQQDAAADSVILQIADNGTGLRPNGSEGGFGQGLVRSFASYLGGTLVYSEPTAMGTAITLTMQRAAPTAVAAAADTPFGA
jgi:two-component sensor histidine kinase